MPDNPAKTRADRHFVSGQKHEIDAFVESMQKEFPSLPKATIEDALEACRQNPDVTSSRSQLLHCVRKILSQS